MNAVKLADQISAQAAGKSRYFIAIAGPPGAGKSTFADALCTALSNRNVRSKIIPMDGFHKSNAELSELGLLKRKGAPETFDANGFVNLIETLTSVEAKTAIPVFDRDTDAVIADADIVTGDDAILLVEGNYLLLDELPWAKLKTFWDQTISINPGIDVLEERLVERWLDQGFDPDKARERAMSNDIPNAHYVIEKSFGADIQIN